MNSTLTKLCIIRSLSMSPVHCNTLLANNNLFNLQNSILTKSFTSFFVSHSFVSFRCSNSRFTSFLDSAIKIRAVQDIISDKYYRFPVTENKKINNKKINRKEIIIQRCVFEKGKAKKGGGIFCEYCFVKISDCAIKENKAEFTGGVYLSQSHSINISRTLIFNNTASFVGGTYLDGNNETADLFEMMEETNISNNIAKEWTGGIRLDHGGGIIKNCYIAFNKAGTCGGCLDFAWKPSVRNITDTIFISNKAKERGGAFCGFHIMHLSHFNRCGFYSNHCDLVANSIYIESVDAFITLDQCDFSGEENDELGMRFIGSKIDQNNVTFSSKTEKVYARLQTMHSPIPPNDTIEN